MDVTSEQYVIDASELALLRHPDTKEPEVIGGGRAGKVRGIPVQIWLLSNQDKRRNLRGLMSLASVQHPTQCSDCRRSCATAFRLEMALCWLMTSCWPASTTVLPSQSSRLLQCCHAIQCACLCPCFSVGGATCHLPA